MELKWILYWSTSETLLNWSAFFYWPCEEFQPNNTYCFPLMCVMLSSENCRIFFHLCRNSQVRTSARCSSHWQTVVLYHPSLQATLKFLCVDIPDPRFPDYGKVELVFSEGPEKIQGIPPFFLPLSFSAHNWDPWCFLPVHFGSIIQRSAFNTDSGHVVSFHQHVILTYTSFPHFIFISLSVSLFLSLTHSPLFCEHWKLKHTHTHTHTPAELG